MQMQIFFKKLKLRRIFGSKYWLKTIRYYVTIKLLSSHYFTTKILGKNLFLFLIYNFL